MIVDAYNLFTRHYIAHPGMSKNGDQVGGIVGFFNNLIRLVERVNPENIYIIWEGGGSKRKRDIFPEYKHRRRPQKLNRYYDDIPDSRQNRNFQITLLISILDKFPITQIYVEDAEADDAIGYICKYKLSKKDIIIISSDHDFFQLVNSKTIIWSPTLKDFVDSKKVLERFGIHPNNFCLAKSISGDMSDNIDGVKGVSYKSLSKYFIKFKSKEDYLMQDFFDDVTVLSEKKKLKILNSIINSKNKIKRNWRLIHLDVTNLSHYQTAKIDQKIEKVKNTCDNIGAHKILNENGIINIDLLKAKLLFKNLNQGNKN